MIRLSIDGRPVEVEAGSTILDAARRLGLPIPALCHVPGLPPSTSCMACVVRVPGIHHLVPSCATAVHDGMEVESETEEVRRARRTALELLLSDHVGDCMAPCHLSCPATMDIARMNREIAAGDLRGALITVKRDIALPAALGRICPAPCEKGCRRGSHDAPVSICLLKRHVADIDLQAASPYLPPRRPESGKRIAIVGAGPAGLAAAYYARVAGHACVVLDKREKPGGMLRYAVEEDRLPRGVLDAEIAIIERLGAEFRMGVEVGAAPALAELSAEFDAVFLAVGEIPPEERPRFGLAVGSRGFSIERRTYRASVPGVFAGGGAVGPTRMAVLAVAHGKEAAVAIDQYLRGETVTGYRRPFTSRIGKLKDGEIERFLPEGSADARFDPAGGFPAGLAREEAAREALRCLHCDCRKAGACTLRDFSDLYGAEQARFKAERDLFEQSRRHAHVIYEPGKCIRCGVCVRIAEEAREPLGLTFIGRGFSVRVGVPFDEPLAAALTIVGRRCVEACPTGALAEP